MTYIHYRAQAELAMYTVQMTLRCPICPHFTYDSQWKVIREGKVFRVCISEVSVERVPLYTLHENTCTCLSTDARILVKPND